MSTTDAYRFEAGTRNTSEQTYMGDLERALADSTYSETEKMMNFALYTPRQDLTRFIAKHEIFKRILPVHGSVVECGVFFGGGLLTWAQLSAIYEPTNHSRRVIGFDTFGGFEALDAADAGAENGNAHEGGYAVDSYAEIAGAIELFDRNRFVGHIPKVELVRGDACATIPAYVQDNPHLVVSLLYLDFDVYGPTKVALETFLPRMPEGAVIAFDELNLKAWPGETVALLESVELARLRLERFPFASTISFAQIGRPLGA
jgi:hypothetical protein